jgi:hypothetical protein
MRCSALRVFVAFAAAASGMAWAQGGAQAGGGEPRWSVSAEALLMWFKSSPTPVPIITDDYANLPGTKVLLGGGFVDTNPNAGVRITGTYRVDSRWGMELSGFYVPSRSTSSSVSSSGQLGSADLLLPYFDVTTNQESYTEISFSPDYRGEAKTTLDNNLGGFELNATWALAPQGGWKTDLLGGFRFLQLRESYTITTSSPFIPPNPADVWNTTDAFDTRNRFFGVQVGLRTWYDSGPWLATGTGKVALGNMQQRASISGFLETNDFNDHGVPQILPSGYFALPSNSGDHSRNTFAVVPEIGVSVGYRITPQATVYVGYAFLYASSVVRPGEQINRNINTTQSVSFAGDPPAKPVGALQPSFSFNSTDFWAQSVSLGFAYRF